jgi:pyrrolidone-carboxylate peptidase
MINPDFKIYKKIKIYLTGYGPFLDVTENPSQKLVQLILEEKQNLKENCEIVYDKIYQVSVDHVKENVRECHSVIKSNMEKPEVLHLLVHFGVNTGGKNIHLETRAQNYIKDYLKLDCLIDENHDDFFCKIDLDKIASELQEKQHNVTTSINAGTYLCNYIYFISSCEFKDHENVVPLFIHIPSIEDMDLEKCRNFFYDFVGKLHEKYL